MHDSHAYSFQKAILTFSGAEKSVLHFLVEHKSWYMISKGYLIFKGAFLTSDLAYSRP